MEEQKSKSQKKREAEALQKVGIGLIALSEAKLEKLPLSTLLRQAILDAKVIKSHGAIRRQVQLIGKLMREADHDQIVAAYETLIAEESAQTANFHEIEQWRDRLIVEGREALTDFVNRYHPKDIQQLRQLVKKAIQEKNRNQSTGAMTALFRFLRSCMS